MSRGWSDEEDEILKNDWAGGLSASQIAHKLPADRTRSSVLGRVHRLGLPQRAPLRVTQERVKRHDPLLSPARMPARPLTDNTEDPGPMDPPLDTLNIRDHHCKWPYDAPEGGYHYCGQPPKEGRPWCPFHCKKAHQPPKTSAA